MLNVQAYNRLQVRRRERCKRQQYRLIRDTLAAQGSQPDVLLPFFEVRESPYGLRLVAVDA